MGEFFSFCICKFNFVFFNTSCIHIMLFFGNICLVLSFFAYFWDVNTFNYEKGHPYYKNLHPIYKQTTSQQRGRRSENFKKCLISSNWRLILGKRGHRGNYFWPSFMHAEFRFALMFPFNTQCYENT